jgi:hypothetical protein
VPRHLLASDQQPAAFATYARDRVSVVPRLGAAAHRTLSRLRRGKLARRRSTTTTCCSTGT